MLVTQSVGPSMSSLQTTRGSETHTSRNVETRTAVKYLISREKQYLNMMLLMCESMGTSDGCVANLVVCGHEWGVDQFEN